MYIHKTVLNSNDHNFKPILWPQFKFVNIIEKLNIRKKKQAIYCANQRTELAKMYHQNFQVWAAYPELCLIVAADKQCMDKYEWGEEWAPLTGNFPESYKNITEQYWAVHLHLPFIVS